MFNVGTTGSRRSVTSSAKNKFRKANVYDGTHRKTGGISQGDSMTPLNDMIVDSACGPDCAPIPHAESCGPAQ